MTLKRVCVIVPALNEAGNVGALVRDVFQQKIHHVELSVMVVDNGSTDATVKQARSAGANVVVEPRQGYGYACAAGVNAARDAQILVFMDADYSSLPEELPVVLEPLLSETADLCLGSRELGNIEPGAMPSHQRFGNRLASMLTRLLYGVHVTDLGPFRAVGRDTLLSLDMREMTYGWPTEMTVKAIRRGLRIVEAPVSWCKRQSGHSKVSGTLRGALLAGWFILGVTLKYALVAGSQSKELT
jgi:glycosyltransferase involved in cell wall biosynthesis